MMTTLRALSLFLLFSSPLLAQCANDWLPGQALPGLHDGHDLGKVYETVMWDPDGAGPLAERLVVAGEFTEAGSTACNNIAAYDPVAQQWTSFGGGMSDSVVSLAVLPNGDLLAGGRFDTAGGANVPALADGTEQRGMPSAQVGLRQIESTASWCCRMATW